MKKSELSQNYRAFAQSNLSPTQGERDLVSQLFEAVKRALGLNIFMAGSYARYTSIRPMHDIDIIFIAGKYNPSNLNPSTILSQLKIEIERRFQNPTEYMFTVLLQSHSISINFKKNEEEVFSIDIVPAFEAGEINEFGTSIYYVPEILKVGHRRRQMQYEEFNKIKTNEKEWWIKSDPRGYISAASILNQNNSDFRKTVKLLKRWKYNCKNELDNFKLKSFHIEQIVYNIFFKNQQFDVSDAIFTFFVELIHQIDKPKITDRADKSTFIDAYISSLTSDEKEIIIQLRDGFLIKLEEIKDTVDINDLLKPMRRTRKSSTESYLFDLNIPTYTTSDNTLNISAKVLQRDGGFREEYLGPNGKINVDRNIEFKLREPKNSQDIYKWKVKNDDNSPDPRGEITDHQTRNNPENTKYRGNHHVECYQIRDGICIARAKQPVVL